MYLFNFLPHWVVCGILVPQLDQTHNPLQWKLGLNVGPRKS